MIETTKRKVTSLFSKSDKELLWKAIDACHEILTEATHLLKAYYVFQFENASHPLSPEACLAIDDTLLDVCCLIVRGEPLAFRKRADKEPSTEDPDKLKALQTKAEETVSKKAYRLHLYNNITEFYSTHFPTVEKKREKTTSLSHILTYSVEQMITAYHNNVWMHFPKYVKKLINCILLSRAQNTSPDGETTSQERKDIRAKAAKISSHLLYATEFQDPQIAEAAVEFQELLPSLPVLSTSDSACNRLYDMKTRAWTYLQYMVWMNIQLESETLTKVPPKTRRLNSPLALVSTFIPNHIRLDTSGVAQLFMTKERIKDFVNIYFLEHGVRLKMTTKMDMLSSYSKLTGISSPSPREEAMYATALWKYICNFTNYADILHTERRSGEVWVFDNMILTDGYSVSFQLTREEQLCRKQKFKKKKDVSAKKIKPKKPVKVAKPKEFPDYLDEEFSQCWNVWEKTSNGNPFRLLSCDPGKSDITTLTDGFTTLRYTKKQRDNDTYAQTRKKVSLKIRKKNKVIGTYNGQKDPFLHDYECQTMSTNSKKSCILKTFMSYWKSRHPVSESPNNPYKKAYYRNIKFKVFTAQKSSEDAFMDRIGKTYLNAPLSKLEMKRRHYLRPLNKDVPDWLTSPTCSIKEQTVAMMIANKEAVHQKSKILIGYGNWGQNPNLKGNAPTPGIGIRRRIHKMHKTVTVNERDTSWPCPCCGSRVEYPNVGKDSVSKHHLQRCTNVDCPCSWWNRNTVGSFNIHRRFIDSLCKTEG